MNEQYLEGLGPLRPLAGIWEGGTGDDTAPSDDRGVEINKYRERMVLEPFKPAENHEQTLFGLRYSTLAWRIGEEDPFHDEVGYWLWDPKARQVMKCVAIPRGVVLIAGGSAEPDARSFLLKAELGSKTFGICSNPFLDLEFQTVGFELKMSLNQDGSFDYDQNTRILLKGQKTVFDHRDKNRLRPVKK